MSVVILRAWEPEATLRSFHFDFGSWIAVAVASGVMLRPGSKGRALCMRIPRCKCLSCRLGNPRPPLGVFTLVLGLGSLLCLLQAGCWLPKKRARVERAYIHMQVVILQAWKPEAPFRSFHFGFGRCACIHPYASSYPAGLESRGPSQEFSLWFWVWGSQLFFVSGGLLRSEKVVRAYVYIRMYIVILQAWKAEAPLGVFTLTLGVGSLLWLLQA